MIAEVIGLGAALSYIESLGRDAIWEHGQQLLAYVTKKLTPMVRILGTATQKGPILTFTVPGIHPLDLGTFLNLRGIAVRTGNLCAQPALAHFGVTSAVRLSFAPYNTIEEIDLFVEAFREIISRL
jgi:cysteine desulfurase/selenocysteine lyase